MGLISNQTVAGETWHMIEGANTLSQSKNTQKKGQAQIAAGNRAVGSEELVLDAVLPTLADGQVKDRINNLGSKGNPRLFSPAYNSSVFDGADEQETGLISIIGNVLALQAKSNSNFWQTLWKQAGESMRIQVGFAPIIREAIENQYLNQSQATKAQANQSETDAWISLGMFALTAGTAKVMECQETAEDIGPKDKAIETQKETDPLKSTETQLDRDAETVMNDTNTNKPSIKRDAPHCAAKSKPALKKALSLLKRGLEVAQLTDMISKFSTGLNDSKYQQTQSDCQLQEGKQAAASQEGQMYSQFYGQDFSRMEELRQGSSQNIDTAMNILQQAANTITQTSTSMFRG